MTVEELPEDLRIILKAMIAAGALPAFKAALPTKTHTEARADPSWWKFTLLEPLR